MTDPEADTDTARKGSQKGRGKEKQGKGLPGKLRRSHYRHSLWLRM